MKKRTLIGVGAALAGAVVLFRKAGLRETLDWESVAKPGRLIDVDGYRVHYVEAGAGPAIVLIHGFGGQTYSYRKLLPIFARDHRVIAVDLKGYGYSERDAYTDLSQSGQVAMLRSLLAKLGIERAVFVGHSMGGGVVQRFAATHPEMVEAAVLAASVTGEERSRRRMPPAFLARPLAPLLAKMMSSRIIRASFYDPSDLTPEVHDEYMRPVRIKGSMDEFVAIMRAGASDPAVDASKITMPVLLLNGADDRVVPLSAAQRIRERIPQARLVVIDRAAHMLLEEQPEECARAIVDFLRDAHAGLTREPLTAG
jgi:pimeloyl-ACP methyl ester carboxylesterase